MTGAPKVSVIMPAFNCAGYIGEAMASVAAQTYKDLELIVIDDGSSDGTGAVVSAFMAEHAGLRLKHLRQENKGAAAARNAGIAASEGEYLAFLDCDDLWLPRRLEVQVPVLEGDSGAGLVFGGAVSFGEGLAESLPVTRAADLAVAGHTAARLFSGNYISTLTVLIRKSCLDKTGPFDESVSVVEDYDLWLRIAKHYRITGVDALVAKYRVHPGNMSRVTGGREEKLLQDLIKIRRRALEQNPGIARELSPAVLERCFYRLYLNLASFYLKRGDMGRARAGVAAYLGLYRLNPLGYLLYFMTLLPPRLNALLWRLRGGSGERP